MTTKSHPTSPIEALRSLLKNYFVAIFGAAAIALLLRVYVVEAFRIPTDLMAPMLLPGDHIFVNKLAYNGPFGFSTQTPHRTDVVVFAFPNEPDKDYIKRSIGLPGDTVEIKSEEIFLNGKNISRHIKDDLYEEEIDGHKYQVRWDGTPQEERSMVKVTVPKDELFLLGDNRARGQDSRVWGFLPISDLQGKASMVWFSSDQGQVRWSRLFKKVE